jgi:tetratricopeptide (TPR) repeat protein/TolB-like protein
MVGRTLSHYQILEEVSRGGMGIVYRALDVRLNREVALKVLPEDLVHDAGRRERLMQEARAASAIEHPNIAVIHAVEEADGVTFIAMELIRGDKLSDVIGRERLPAKRALDLAIEVAEGLARAHEKNVVHRDLKPANIMVTDGGHAKVIDFGLAKLVAPLGGDSATATALGGQTDPGVILGTVAYMSPEQARGTRVDHRSDIFSFGIVLYEMLTGRPPFQGRSSIDTLNAILNQPAPALPALTGVPVEAAADIQRVIEKCVAKDPNDRYQGMKDLVVDLRIARRHLESSVVGVTGATARMSVPSTRRANWKLIAGAAGVMVVVASLVLGGLLLWRARSAPAVVVPPDAKPSMAVLYFDNNTGNASLDWMRKGLTDMMVTDLSQSPDIEVIGTDRLQQILSDLHHPNDTAITADIAQQVAERAGVKSVLIGSFIKAGDTIRISARLQDAKTSKIVSAERVEGVGDSSLFSMIDELTRRIKAKVDSLRSASAPFSLLPSPGGSGAVTRTGVDRGLTEVTTASVDAYRYYAEGIDLHDRSLEAQAIPLFEKAVSIDPGFAMALAKLAVAENNVGNTAKRDEYAKRALDKVDRLTPRERYYIEGYFYSNRVDTVGRAIDAYTKGLALYPDHQSSRHNLALIYLNLERLPECIAQYEELVRRGAVSVTTYGNLASCYVRSGRVDQALAVMQEFARQHPEVSAGHAIESSMLMAAGRLDDAMAALVKAEALDPGSLRNAQTRWVLLAFLGQWPDADGAAQKQAASSNPFEQWLGRINLATARLVRGETAAALAQVDQSVRLKGLSANYRASGRGFAGATFLDLSKPADALSQGQAGMADAENRPEEFGMLRIIASAQSSLGRKADADAALAKLKQQAGLLPGNAQQRTLHWAAGEVALARGDSAAAIAELEQAQTMLPPHGSVNSPSPYVPICFSLASAYRAAGKDAEAARWFQRVADSGFERVYSPIQYVRSFYFLGAIAEKQGNLEKARQYFQRFVGFWKNGDIDRDRVAEAQRKIGG